MHANASFLDLSDRASSIFSASYTTKPLPAVPTMSMQRSKRPAPLTLPMSGYSSHQVALDPLSPFAADSRPSSPLRSPSLWLASAGIVEPVGPKMSATGPRDYYYHNNDVYNDGEDTPRESMDQLRVRKIVKVMRTLGDDVPVRLVCPPSSAFDNDSDDEGSEKLGMKKRVMQAFKRKENTKPAADAKKNRRRVQVFKASPPPSSDDSDDDSDVSLPSHTDATYARRPSLVESLLLGNNSAVRQSTVSTAELSLFDFDLGQFPASPPLQSFPTAIQREDMYEPSTATSSFDWAHIHFPPTPLDVGPRDDDW